MTYKWRWLYVIRNRRGQFLKHGTHAWTNSFKEARIFPREDWAEMSVLQTREKLKDTTAYVQRGTFELHGL